MRRLEGQVALVTGASRGIGRAILARLGTEGAYVIGTATGPEGRARIDDDLASGGLAGTSAELRVESSASVAELFAALDRNPSILVNNAAVTRDGLLARMSEADWDAVIETNLGSVFRLCKACLRSMMRARHGRIVSIASIVGTTGNAGQANYAAAKAGILGFTKSLAREVAARGITVNAVAPGFIDTDMSRALSDAQREALLAGVPLGRLGAVEEVAAAVAFLASPEAGYITGETLHVNGGMHMT